MRSRLVVWSLRCLEPRSSVLRGAQLCVKFDNKRLSSFLSVRCHEAALQHGCELKAWPWWQVGGRCSSGWVKCLQHGDPRAGRGAVLLSTPREAAAYLSGFSRDCLDLVAVLTVLWLMGFYLPNETSAVSLCI